MTLEMLVILAILVIAIILFTTEIIRVDVVALGVVASLALSGILSPEESLSGFSNPVVITMAALFMIGGGITQTGLADYASRRILALAGSRETRLVVLIMGLSAALSSVLSDSGTVAILLPASISIAKASRIPASKLLLPMTIGSLFGGATTLIGTPPNLIVADLMQEAGIEPFSFFSFTPIGLILLAAGMFFLVALGHSILPDRKTEFELQSIETPQAILERYQMPRNIMRLRVRRESTVVDLDLRDTPLRDRYGITVLEVFRRKQQRRLRPFDASPVLAEVGSGYDPIQVMPDTKLEVDDLLTVQGDPTLIGQAVAELNLGVQPVDAPENQDLLSEEAGVAEVLIPSRSVLQDQTLSTAQFGTRYGLTVLAIERPSAAGQLDLKSTELRFGDVLLVQGPWKNILALQKQRRDFVVMGQPEAVTPAPNRNKAFIATAILAAMLFLMISQLIPVVTAAILAALCMILTGCLSMDEAYRIIDWKSILLIAGMIPMSIALQKVGLVDLVANSLSSSLGQFSPVVLLAGLFLLTAIFTQVISNTATTVVVAPVALSAATSLAVQPEAFLMGVAIAASMAFASPIASPVNTMIMGAGNYRFSDYLKAGLPLLLITFVLAMLALPLLWPF